MTDYAYIFSKALHEKLKGKILAGIYVKGTDDDKLEITIARKSEDLVFNMYIDNLGQKIMYGYSTEYAVYEIVEKYKRFIHNRYFTK